MEAPIFLVENPGKEEGQGPGHGIMAAHSVDSKPEPVQIRSDDVDVQVHM